MRYFISDLHFFHESLNTRMDCRGFESLEAMHEHMIEKWNGRVKANDEVVILGDFSSGKAIETMEVLKRLNGRKQLIIGNHDDFLEEKEFDKSLFEWIEPYKELKDNKRKIVLSHYPIFCYNGQNRINEDGSPKAFMLYGHVHNSFDEVLVHNFIQQTRAAKRPLFDGGEQDIPCNMINCFCMYSDYTPLTLDEWIALDAKRRGKLKTVRVVAAVIRDGEKIFATARGYGEYKGGWEFPGGKIEQGETPEEALAREIKEELDTEISVGELIQTVEYDYPGFHLSMDCFWCSIISGDLVLKEAEAAKWLTFEELDTVDWLPADMELVETLKKALKGE